MAVRSVSAFALRLAFETALCPAAALAGAQFLSYRAEHCAALKTAFGSRARSRAASQEGQICIGESHRSTAQ